MHKKHHFKDYFNLFKFNLKHFFHMLTKMWKMFKASNLFKALKIYLNHDASKYLYEFLYIIFSLGLILSIIFHTLFGHSFSLPKLLGFGLLCYLIKVELPAIISNCLGKRNNGGDGSDGGGFI